jgi:hypothetical protein
MALSQTYGKLEIPMIGEDEPVFILRGQDILAHSAIEMYRLLAKAHGCQVAQALTGELSCFRRWQGERRLPSWPAQGRTEKMDHVASISRCH